MALLPGSIVGFSNQSLADPSSRRSKFHLEAGLLGRGQMGYQLKAMPADITYIEPRQHGSRSRWSESRQSVIPQAS